MGRDGNTKGRAILLTGLAVVAAAGAALSRTDMLLSRGFGKAIADARPALSFAPMAHLGQSPRNVAGDEGYWLTRAEAESPTPLAKTLVLGDRISIAGRDGNQRQFEVVDLKAIGATAGRLPNVRAHAHLLLVTCRTVAGSVGNDGPSAATVRFIIEAEPTDAVAQAPAKSL
jgi:hypothetical protein